MDDVIVHFGVKGMKWGVRKDKKARTPGSEDHETSRKLKKTKLRDLSNKELQTLNNRLQLERTNNDLQSRSALAKIKRGTAATTAILAVPAVGVTVYKQYNSQAGKAAREAIARALSR